MRKVNGIVVYNPETNHVYSFVVNTRNGTNIYLIWDNDKAMPYNYPSFSEMYKYILKLAKENGFYFDSYNEFETTWYNIAFIESDAPQKISHYSLREEK